MPSLGSTLAALRRRTEQTGAHAADHGALTDVGDVSPNPGDLRMRAYVPPGLAKKAPLVVVLHGCGQTAEGYAIGSGWLTLADRFGFALLCPEQVRSNNANLCFNWFEPGDIARASGEAESIAAMVRRLVADHDLDVSRVFVTGLSAGGAMTTAMLATYPEMFAGGAVIAGLAYGSAGSMMEAFAAMNNSRTTSAAMAGNAVRVASGGAGPWPPISIWHGQSDSVVKPGAGEALAAQWVNVHGIDAAPITARTPSGRDFLVWMTPEGDPVVELHRIPGMGHGTPLSVEGPDGSGTAGPYLLEVGISSSLEIALGWGIAQAPLAMSGETVVSADDRERPATKAVTPAGSPGSPVGVSAVIEQALRAAGLMR